MHFSYDSDDFDDMDVAQFDAMVENAVAETRKKKTLETTTTSAEGALARTKNTVARMMFVNSKSNSTTMNNNTKNDFEYRPKKTTTHAAKNTANTATTQLHRKQQQQQQQQLHHHHHQQQQQQRPVSEIDLAAAQTYIYPAQVNRREYQYAIAANALVNNTLVCLPTGLGKTLIAAVVMLNYKRWFPNGKIVFVAPTRPLVDQQMQACHDVCGIPSEETVVLMGSTKKKGKTVSDSRRELWTEKKVFFCTPQVVSNDIETGDLNAKDVVCLVVDEAHRAVGNYAYTKIVAKLKERGAVFRILALTATPGKEVENVQKIVTSLDISRVDFRSEVDVDVAKYTFRRDLIVEPIGQDDVSTGILTLLKDSMRPHLKRATGFGAFSNNNYNQEVGLHGLGYQVKRFLDVADAEPPAYYPLMQTTKYIQRGQIQMGNKEACGHSMRHASYIAHIIDLFTKFGPSQAHEYIMKDFTHASVLSEKYVEFKEACELIRSLASNGAKHSPKLQKLVKVVEEQFSNSSNSSKCSGEKTLTDFFSAAKSTVNGGHAKSDDDKKKKKIDGDTRVMIFCSYRDTVRDIVEQLREIKPKGEKACRVKVAPFVGQSSGENARDRRNREKSVLAKQQQNITKAGGGGEDTDDALIFEKQKGQKQAEQKAVLEDFRNGNLNCLVATSIGEEGLDIPSVDLIIFYDVVDVIRTVQRMGRTGRARNGKVVVLATKGKEHNKFTTELRKYRDLQAKMRTPEKYVELCKNAPRMIPDEIFPSCELICIESTSKKEKNGAKSRIEASLAKRTKQQQEHQRDGIRAANARKYTSTSTLIFDANPTKQYQALDVSNRSILFAYQDTDEMKRKATAAAASSPLMFEEDEDQTLLQEMKSKGFAGSLPYQCQYQKVYNFEHGAMTKFLVRAMSKLQGIERSPMGPGAPTTNTSNDDFDETVWCGDAIAGGAVNERRLRAQRIRDGVNLRVNEGVDIDEYDRKIFPLHPSDAEDEDKYHYGAGIEDNDYEIPVMKRGDEDESMENDGILIMSDIDDELVTAAPGEEEKEKIVQDVPLSDAGTRAEPPISFPDDEEVNEVKCHDHDCHDEMKSEQEERKREENDDDEVIVIEEKESPNMMPIREQQKSPSAAEAARMRLSSAAAREPSLQSSRKKSVEAAPILSRVSLATENQELVEKTLDNLPLNILKEHVQLAREKVGATEERRRRSVSMPPPDPREPRTNSSNKKKNHHIQQQQQQQQQTEASFPSDESLRFKRRRREKSPKEPSPVLPLVPDAAASDVAANKKHKKQEQERRQEQSKKPWKKKSAFLDDIAGGEGSDDEAKDYDYDSEDARFIDDESPETGDDVHRHHPQYFSSAGNTDDGTNKYNEPFTNASNKENPYTQPTPMVNLGETFARFGPRNRHHNVQDTPPDSSMENHTQTTDEYEDSFINDDEIDYETEEDDGILPSVRKSDKEKKKKKVLLKKSTNHARKKRVSDGSMSLSDAAMMAKVSEARHGFVSTLPSNNNSQEKEKKGDECERNPPQPLAPPAPAPVVVDLLDDEFEDDWKKGNSDDEDW